MDAFNPLVALDTLTELEARFKNNVHLLLDIATAQYTSGHYTASLYSFSKVFLVSHQQLRKLEPDFVQCMDRLADIFKQLGKLPQLVK